MCVCCHDLRRTEERDENDTIQGKEQWERAQRAGRSARAGEADLGFPLLDLALLDHVDKAGREDEAAADADEAEERHLADHLFSSNSELAMEP